MERRWIAFFLVCALAYIAYYQHIDARSRAYKQHLAEVAALEAYNSDLGDGFPDIVAEDDGTSFTLATMSPGPDTPAPVRETVDTAPSTVVSTATSRLKFSHLGARVISWQLLNSTYVVNRPGDEGVEDGGLELVPQVGDNVKRGWPLDLLGTRVDQFNNELFSLVQTTNPAGDEVLTFTSERSVQGVRARKVITLPKNGYLARVQVSFENTSDARIPLASRGPGVGIGWLGGFGFPTAQDRVHGVEQVVVALGDKVVTKKLAIDDSEVEYSANVAWAGVERKFFTAIVIPNPANPAVSAFARVRDHDDAAIYHEKGIPPPHSVELYSAAKELGVGETKSLDYNVYVGPVSARVFSTLSPPIIPKGAPLSATAFHSLPFGFGWARPVCLVLLPVLVWLEAKTLSWGVAIILLTCLIKILVLPLTHAAIKFQAETMHQQGMIKPELDLITKKYKNDMQARNVATMKLYKDKGISPFGPMRGCLPMLAQMPVFVGLYVVFDQAVELRGQDFMWISDLSQPDRLFGWGMTLPVVGAFFNILPILMSVTQFVSMKMMQMPSTGDEMQQAVQKQMMYMMPVLFGFMLYQMPAGLMLYWVVSNIWAIGQSHITKKVLAKHQARLAAERGAVTIIKSGVAP